MSIKAEKLLTDWLNSNKWEDEVEAREEGAFVMNSGVGVGQQSYRLFVEASDKTHCVDVFLYTPYAVKTARRGEVLELINYINGVIAQGRFRLADDGIIGYRHRIDCEGMSPIAKSIDLMLGPAWEWCKKFDDAFVAVGLTKVSAKEAIEDLGSN